MNTALYLLRAKQIGLSLSEMDVMEEGMVLDLLAESANDRAAEDGAYRQIATQQDFDRW